MEINEQRAMFSPKQILTGVAILSYLTLRRPKKIIIIEHISDIFSLK